MKINQIWEELEKDNSCTKGLLLRRYSASHLPDLFVALNSPEKQRSIAVTLNKSVQLELSRYNNLKVIQISLGTIDSIPDKQILIITLADNQNRDIFSVLCEDLISTVNDITTEHKLIVTLLNRFEKWKSLFDKALGEGLTEEEQRGLYGELYFLRILLNKYNNSPECITSWVGSEKQVRDFQKSDWAVEVKTTHGKNHQKIQISNERQLDTSTIQHLFLYHISLDIMNESGETLNQITDSIQSILSSDYYSLQIFRKKLLESGYFVNHRHVYDKTGYQLRSDTFYKVEDTFPRIEESDLRSGVGDVKYSIIVSNCNQYIISTTELFSFISL